MITRMLASMRRFIKRDETQQIIPDARFSMPSVEIVKSIFTAGFTDLLQRLNARTLLWGVVLSYITGGIASFALDPGVRGWVLCATAIVATVLADATAGNEQIIAQLKAWFLWIERRYGVFGLESLANLYRDYRNVGSQTKAIRAALWRSAAGFCGAGVVTLYNAKVPLQYITVMAVVDIICVVHIIRVLGKKNLPAISIEDEDIEGYTEIVPLVSSAVITINTGSSELNAVLSVLEKTNLPITINILKEESTS